MIHTVGFEVSLVRNPAPQSVTASSDSSNPGLCDRTLPIFQSEIGNGLSGILLRVNAENFHSVFTVCLIARNVPQRPFVRSEVDVSSSFSTFLEQ